MSHAYEGMHAMSPFFVFAWLLVMLIAAAGDKGAATIAFAGLSAQLWLLVFFVTGIGGPP